MEAVRSWFACRRARVALVAAAALFAVALGACGEPDPPPPPPPPPPPVAVFCDAPAGSSASSVPVMGPCARLDADQLTSWFEAQSRPTYRAGASVHDLISMYIDEGQAEGVRGDIAFMQSIIETGWFSFSGRVPPSANNFSGLGATDGTSLYATFPDVRTGVRAQIQHLRAYADATATTCTDPPLHNLCVDPRFALVWPKGKAPTWNQFGNGVWATDPSYATKVLNLYTSALADYGLALA